MEIFFRSDMKSIIRHVINFRQLSIKDIALVGGKNASLGEMIKSLAKGNVKVPAGFATTTAAFKDFLAENRIDKQIYSKLNSLDPKNLTINLLLLLPKSTISLPKIAKTLLLSDPQLQLKIYPAHRLLANMILF